MSPSSNLPLVLGGTFSRKGEPLPTDLKYSSARVCPDFLPPWNQPLRIEVSASGVDQIVPPVSSHSLGFCTRDGSPTAKYPESSLPC